MNVISVNLGLRYQRRCTFSWNKLMFHWITALGFFLQMFVVKNVAHFRSCGSSTSAAEAVNLFRFCFLALNATDDKNHPLSLRNNFRFFWNLWNGPIINTKCASRLSPSRGPQTDSPSRSQTPAGRQYSHKSCSEPSSSSMIFRAAPAPSPSPLPSEPQPFTTCVLTGPLLSPYTSQPRTISISGLCFQNKTIPSLQWKLVFFVFFLTFIVSWQTAKWCIAATCWYGVWTKVSLNKQNNDNNQRNKQTNFNLTNKILPSILVSLKM